MLVLGVACTSPEADSPAAPVDVVEVDTTLAPLVTTTGANQSTTTTSPTSPTSPTSTTSVAAIPREDVPPLALYLAAIDNGLMGTEYQGDVYLDPDGYVNVGRLFCSLLDAGVSPTGVLESYISALEAESQVLSDDDLVLGGVVLGASVQLICPAHIDDLTEVIDGGDLDE